MFTFAKFVSFALGFLTVGSTGAFVTPVTFTDSLYKTGKNAKDHFDLAEFKNEEHKLKTRLDSLKTDFSRALLATEASKNYKLKKIQEKFDELKSKEESLRKQYEEITEEIKKISDLLTKESEASKRKLNSESALSLLKVYERHFDTISKHFSNQKQNVLEIVCTIDKTIKKQEIQSGQVCADESWKKTLESPSQAGPSQVAGGASSSTEAKASEEALKKLGEVKETLHSMSKQIETWVTRINSENEGVKKISAIFETYVAIAENTVQLLKIYQKKASDRVEEGVRASKEIVNQVNKLNEEIVQLNKDWGLLKKQFTVLKAYEGKLSDSLCSLYTTLKTNCTNSALEQETI